MSYQNPPQGSYHTYSPQGMVDLLHILHHQGTHLHPHPHPLKGTRSHHNRQLGTLLHHPQVKGIKGISVEEGTLHLLLPSSITSLSTVSITDTMIRMVVPLFTGLYGCALLLLFVGRMLLNCYGRCDTFEVL